MGEMRMPREQKRESEFSRIQLRDAEVSHVAESVRIQTCCFGV
jgi:hypothetical protein